MHVEIVTTEELGDRSYIAHDGTTAIVVDPQRDLDRVEAVLQGLHLTLDLVLETHIHNDYVTGGCELARDHGVRYAVNAADPVEFDRLPVRDGAVLTAGNLRVQAIATPGHTVTHLSYSITDEGHPDEAAAVFTGGSLLYGSVGRTDLVDPERTVELTHDQYHSARRLARELPDATAVFPTHGFGSFCSSGSAAGGDESTIGTERARNDALVTDDEQSFVETLVANLTAYPAYYAHMAPLNLQGPGAADLSAAPGVDPAELRHRLSAGEWVIDLRDRVAYAADHLSGTVGIAMGAQFATYVGWIAPWKTALTLIGESPQQIAEAQRQLSRIGIEKPAGATTADVADLAGQDRARTSYPRVTFKELQTDMPAQDVILDVRREDEYRSGAIEGALNVPLHSILSRLEEIPDQRLWVHCASGYRASIAASLLQAAGRDVVYVDDDYNRAVELKLASQ